jgi:hypothetical protein
VRREIESCEEKLLEVRPDDRKIEDDACDEGVDDAEYHSFIFLRCLFKKQRPLAFPVVVLGSDPDTGYFQLDSKNNKGGHKADTCENLGKCTCSRFVLILFRSEYGRLLG